MEPVKNNDLKQKSRSAYVENGSAINKDPKSSNIMSLPGCSSWYDRHKEMRKDSTIKREQDNQDTESRSGKPLEPAPEITQDQFPNQPAYQNYGYGATDPTYMNNNAAMMSLYSAYGPMAAMNPQWAMNPLDGMGMAAGMNVGPTMAMNSTMDMTGNPAAGIGPYTYMSMTDPNMYGMMGMANYAPYGMMAPGPVKEIIHLSLSSLYPPNPNAPPPSTRPKPPGCKTVFVGGLPENTTEEIMKEIFQSAGEICTIRMSKKNFCHIRFTEETSVDTSIYYSGYRLKVGNKDDATNTGRLHVDFAQARDDQYEYECRQRSLQREARHRERMEQEFYRPPTPPPVVHYTDHEASVLGDNLRNEETFQQATFVLITWLDRGECSKKNSGYFYSMIQSTNSHVRRLMNEKQKFEDELNKAKLMLKQQMRGILLQFHEIDKVFNAASLQKVWDHFTKAQRKNIELWKKQTAEIKDAHVEEVLNDRIEEEMDLSEDEGDVSNIQAENNAQASDTKTACVEELEKLKQENSSLKCQLLASQNEMAVLTTEVKQEKESKEFELHSLRESFSNCYRGIWMKRRRDAADLKEIPPSKVQRTDIEEKANEETCRNKSDEKTSKDNSRSEIPLNTSINSGPALANSVIVGAADIRYIGLVSTFLNVHPFGASVDYICSYLQQIDCTVRARDVEILMKKFPSMFKEESTGIGASLEKKWTFCGFNSQR